MKKFFLSHFNTKTLLYVAIGVCALSLITVSFYIFHLKKTFLDNLSEGHWYEDSTIIYGVDQTLVKNQIFNSQKISKKLKKAGYQFQDHPHYINSGQFSFLDKKKCKLKLKSFFDKNTYQCLIIFHKKQYSQIKVTSEVSFFLIDNHFRILKIYNGFPLKEVFETPLVYQPFLQLYNESPVLRQSFKMSSVPALCLMAITAIEDTEFLDHKGFSLSGIFRALYKNVLKGKKEGGSTITQQLVKNYFLTPEKTLKRKFKELLLSILIELYFTKDDILLHYLNVIYMGQQGILQVKGYSAASDFYFKKPLKKLGGSECALLAALVKSPGHYNPFQFPKKAKERRDFVLEKMHQQNMISSREKLTYFEKPLPQKTTSLSFYQTAPYIIQVVKKELQEINIELKPGMNIFLSLDLQAQKKAQKAVLMGLKNLTHQFDHLKKDSPLQGSILSVHTPTGEVRALVGGINYLTSQFNRVTMSQRQVGSLMKPFVYLEALNQKKTPFTVLNDSPLTYQYKDKVWKPKNYNHKYHDFIPLYFSLTNSLNSSTIRLALELGLENIIQTVKKTGIKTPLKPFPSLALGSFEMSMWDITQGYLSLARFGKFETLHIINKITNKDETISYQYVPNNLQALNEKHSAVLMSLLKQTVLSGTAKNLKKWNFHAPAAGKTGTTNETKDSWFIGMTPYLLTSVWVGYDDNTSHKLTGSAGALPLWASYMKNYNIYPEEDFLWPKNTAIHLINEPYLKPLFSKPDVLIKHTDDLPLQILREF